MPPAGWPCRGFTGRIQARETFERVSRLPRRQQEHILGVVEALLKQAENGRVRA
jgi:hypothetical protein